MRESVCVCTCDFFSFRANTNFFFARVAEQCENNEKGEEITGKIELNDTRNKWK